MAPKPRSQTVPRPCSKKKPNVGRVAKKPTSQEPTFGAPNPRRNRTADLLRMRVELAQASISGTLKVPEAPIRAIQRRRRQNQFPLTRDINTFMYAAKPSRHSKPSIAPRKSAAPIARNSPAQSVLHAHTRHGQVQTEPYSHPTQIHSPDQTGGYARDPSFILDVEKVVERLFATCPERISKYSPEQAEVGSKPNQAVVENSPEQAMVQNSPKQGEVENNLEEAEVENSPRQAEVEVSLEQAVVENSPERAEVEEVERFQLGSQTVNRLKRKSTHHSRFEQSTKRMTLRSAETRKGQGHCKFMAIPLSAREQIYGNILAITTPPDVSDEVFVNEGWSEIYPRWSGGIDTAILRVSQLIWDEALRALYEQNKFCYVVRPRDLNMIEDNNDPKSQQNTDGSEAVRSINLEKYGCYLRHLAVLLEPGRNSQSYFSRMVDAVQEIPGFNAHLHRLTLELNPRRNYTEEEDRRNKLVDDWKENGTSFRWEIDPEDTENQRIQVPRVYHQSGYLAPDEQLMVAIQAVNCNELFIILDIDQHDAGVEQCFWEDDSKMLRIGKRINTSSLSSHRQLRLWDSFNQAREELKRKLEDAGLPLQVPATEFDGRQIASSGAIDRDQLSLLRELLAQFFASKKAAEKGGLSPVWLNSEHRPGFCHAVGRDQVQRAMDQTTKELNSLHGNIQKLFGEEDESHDCGCDGRDISLPKSTPLPYLEYGWEKLPPRSKHPWQRHKQVRSGQ